jgi:hypothetical protein
LLLIATDYQNRWKSRLDSIRVPDRTAVTRTRTMPQNRKNRNRLTSRRSSSRIKNGCMICKALTAGDPRISEQYSAGHERFQYARPGWVLLPPQLRCGRWIGNEHEARMDQRSKALMTAVRERMRSNHSLWRKVLAGLSVIFIFVLSAGDHVSWLP